MTHRFLFIFSIILVAAFVYVSRAVLMPVILSSILAYLLLPAKRSCLQLGLTQTQSTLVVFLPSLSFFVLLLAFMIPLLQEELWNLLSVLPEYGQLISDRVADWQVRLNNFEFMKKFADLQVDFTSFMPDVLRFLKQTLLRVLGSTSFLTDIILYAILLPIFTFYFLRDAEYIFRKISDLVPQQYKKTTLNIFSAIDVRLVSYVRGQFILGLIFMFYYVVFLTSLGLKHALIISFLTGLFFFVPVFTFYISFFIALTIAYLQFDFSLPFFGVLMVYLVGQVLENFILVPRIMGKKVGLSPIWVILALYIGGATMGVVGILISVPVAAILDVLIRYALKVYFKSNYYGLKEPRKGKGKKA